MALTILKSTLRSHPHPKIVLTFCLEQRFCIPHVGSQPPGKLLKDGIQIKNLSTGSRCQFTPVFTILQSSVNRTSGRLSLTTNNSLRSGSFISRNLWPKMSWVDNEKVYRRRWSWNLSESFKKPSNMILFTRFWYGAYVTAALTLRMLRIIRWIFLHCPPSRYIVSSQYMNDINLQYSLEPTITNNLMLPLAIFWPMNMSGRSE